MRLSRKELSGYMENWDDRTRAVLVLRMEERFRRLALEHFSSDEAVLLGAVLDRLIPQDEGERIDLVGFVDGALGKPLGRGDRREGIPEEAGLFHKGLTGIQETAQAMFGRSFVELHETQQDAVLGAIQDGAAKGGVWRDIPSPYFFTRLMTKALTGYCAHPFAWMRMGFPGPSYPEGYVWITEQEVQARRRHFPGWKTL
ncbi:MAG: gluconate 2-dehydrogenase subunit 3 family protein [Nitrospirota bacterium]